MSSEAAETRPKTPARRVQLLIVGILLALHIGWLCVHVWLVKTHQINPWKLGGYAMYTVPHPNALTHVFIFDEGAQKWSELERTKALFNSYLFDRANYLHVFRCRPPSTESLTGFMDENPHLRYRPLTIAITENMFSKDPIGAERKPVATLQIAWAGENKFAYQGMVCGKGFEGSTDYHAPPEHAS
ncbi:hypothetical protein KHP62_09475 [Rhodobacteraceae bacterium NNCM2]|nr:hypothetical protein [Coraliihabitans acroporae]